jgi:hypothetical protein
MASGPRSRLSAPFDDMLVRNKERLEALLHEDRSGHRGDDRDRAAAAPRSGAARGAPFEIANSAAAQYLNERFANRWHYEIAERHRVGDEAIVMCRLFLEDQGVVKTQFGRAKIAADSLGGRSGMVRFRLELSTPEQNEDDAYRRAAENALANCVKLL